MNDEARRTLVELIQRLGPSLAEDARRLEGLLRDYCGSHRREITVLVGAARAGVPQALSDPTSSVPPALRMGHLVQRLQDELAISQAAAEWAVDAWVEALGLSVPVSGLPAVVVPEPEVSPPELVPSVAAPRGGPTSERGIDSWRLSEKEAGSRQRGLVIAVLAVGILGAVVAFNMSQRGSSSENGPASSATTPVSAAGKPAAAAPNTPDAKQQAAAQAPANWKVVRSGAVAFYLGMTDWYDVTGTATIRRTGSHGSPDEKFDYTLVAKQPGIHAARMNNLTTGSAFHASFDVRQLRGSDTTFYGMAFHNKVSPVSNQNDYYVFAANDAHYLFVAKSVAGDFYPIINKRGGAHTRSGEVNRLTVHGEQSTYNLFVNDQFEAQFVDSELQGGEAGIAVTAGDANDALEFEFGTFDVRAP